MAGAQAWLHLSRGLTLVSFFLNPNRSRSGAEMGVSA